MAEQNVAEQKAAERKAAKKAEKSKEVRAIESAREFDRRKAELTVTVISVGKMLKQESARLGEMMNQIERLSAEFDGHPALMTRLAGVRRLVNATRLGLERFRPNLYEINDEAIRERMAEGGK